MSRRLLISILIVAIIPAAAAIDTALSAGQGNLTQSGNKHNLSVSGSGTYTATSETQICIFCHTPHKSLTDGPLWNHTLSSATYTVPTSSTQKSTPANPPDGDSKLCLSCHDGTVPLGSLQSLGTGRFIALKSDVGGVPSVLSGPSLIGTNLSGHHLVSVEITNQLNTDRGTECPSPVQWNVKIPGNIQGVFMRPTAGAATGKGVQCTSCHDPHYDENLNSMFLRTGTVGSWSTSSRNFSDALCLACHCDCGGGPCQ